MPTSSAILHNASRTRLRGYRLVRSFSTPEIRQALAHVGLDDEEVARGQALVAEVQASKPTLQRPKKTPVVGEMLAWAREHFPILRAVLHDEAPDLEARVFDGVVLTKSTTGLFAVETVCERTLALETSKDPRERVVFASLVKHGQTHEVLATALANCVDKPRFEAGSDQWEAYEEAVAALGAFSRKWSRIARRRIQDRRVLRVMGIGRDHGRKAAEPDDDGERNG